MYLKDFENYYASQLFSTQVMIDELFSQASDAYAFSIPLYASALLGDQTRFNTILLKMRASLNSLENNGFKAWLYGRVLLSAKNTGNLNVIKEAKDHIENYLASNPNDTGACATWAIGYLAAFNEECYSLYQQRLLAQSKELSRKYLSTSANNNATADNIQSDLSDAIWAWIMALQAAALAGDSDTYDFIVDQIKSITQQNNLTSALAHGLLRTKASNDYPAWALAIATFSSAQINAKKKDEQNFTQLSCATSGSLQIANQVEKKEAILCKITFALAEMKWMQTHQEKNLSISTATTLK